jgi:hypothetical protein
MTPVAEALRRAAFDAQVYAKWAQAAAEGVQGSHAEQMAHLEALARRDLVEALETVAAVLAGPDAEVTE